MRVWPNNKKSFTLVELLIVILIIGVLAAIIVPKIADISYKTKIAACKANLRSIRTALRFYCMRYGRYPDPRSDQFTPALVPEFLPKIPKNPFNNKNTVCWVYWVGWEPGTNSAGCDAWYKYYYEEATIWGWFYLYAADTNGVAHNHSCFCGDKMIRMGWKGGSPLPQDIINSEYVYEW